MYRKLAALTFSSFFLLAGCSDSDSPATDSSGADSDTVNATNAGEATDTTNTTDVLLATADKSSVRVNGVRLYVNSIPTRTLQYGFNGELLSTLVDTIDVASGKFTRLVSQGANVVEVGTGSQNISVFFFNEFGQLTQIDAGDTVDGIEPVEVVARAEFEYEGEQAITATQMFFDEAFDEPDMGFIAEDIFNFDDNGRLAGGSRFFQGESEQLFEWTRGYNDSGWVETETGSSVDDQLIKNVTVTDDGLIERIVTTRAGSILSTEIWTYDERERLTQRQTFSESGGLTQRTEYLDYQDIDVYWHLSVSSTEVLSLFR